MNDPANSFDKLRSMLVSIETSHVNKKTSLRGIVEHMRFAKPEILYLLICIPLIYLLFFIAHRKRLKEIRALGIVDTLDRFSGRSIEGKTIQEGLFISLAFFFLILSLAKPQAGTRLEPVRIVGSDIYIAMDLSKSMRAEDIDKNRFERAKIDALELIRSLNGDRVGLILFAGDAFVQCPLTTDYPAVAGFIHSLDSTVSVASGTSLKAPLEVAMQTLKPQDDKYTLLVLLTDGENTGDDRNNLERIIKEVQKRGIKVFSIGIGTTEGAPIPVYDENGKRTGYEKDRSGTVVISKLREDLLKDISLRTKGSYLKAGKTYGEISKLLSSIESLKKRELETKKYTLYEDRFQIPLLFAIISIMLYISVSVKVKRRLSQ